MSWSPKLFRHQAVVVTGIVAIIATWSAMCGTGDDNQVIHPNGKAFAGSASCAECHRDISASHIHTAHHQSSRMADTGSVAGSFEDGKNHFFINDTLQAMMQHTDSGLYEVRLARGKETMRKRMDLVIGSGRKGQTYLYWMGDRLFQLPVSYYAPNDVWCNSPGYPTDNLLFNRPVPGACIECHGTYLNSKQDLLNNTHYDKRSLILGIDCERCHGPAADHVAFQRSNPGDTIGRYVINPAKLSRQQKLDNCALCHSGVRTHQTSSFAYVTGDKLDDYTGPALVSDSAAPLDVHGNQYGLLRASKCFRMSAEMTCSSCHDVHRDEGHDLIAYSQKCMSCHQGQKAPFCLKLGHTVISSRTNCIDCHMPAMASRKIFVALSGRADPIPALIRTHLIARYSDNKLAEIKSVIDGFTR